MVFRDPQIQQHYERAAAVIQDCPAAELPVYALLNAWDWFFRTEGETSLRTREVLEHLLSAELRPALRSWYRRHGADMNPAAIEFRDRLSKLAGERFG